MGEAEKFHYIYSCDLDINVQLKMWENPGAGIGLAGASGPGSGGLGVGGEKMVTSLKAILGLAGRTVAGEAEENRRGALWEKDWGLGLCERDSGRNTPWNPTMFYFFQSLLLCRATFWEITVTFYRWKKSSFGKVVVSQLIIGRALLESGLQSGLETAEIMER